MSRKVDMKSLQSFRKTVAAAFLCLCTMLITASLAHGATPTCYVVNPANANNGDGSSWNAAASSGGAGAFNAIPSTLVRGDVYYLADGTYPKYRFSTPASGTTPSELRKAQSYDNCTSVGWSTATMGSAQAVFPWTSVGSIFTVSSSYLIVNGNGNAPAGTIGCGGVYANPPASMADGPPNPSACGIKIDNSTCTSTATNYCAGGNGVISGGGTSIVWESVEWKGSGINANEPYFWLSGEGDDLQTVTGSYLHDMGTTDWTYGFNNATFSYNYSWGGKDSSVNHGEALQDSGNDANMVIHHNVFRDWITNGILVFVDPSTGTHDNFKFYDNVDVCSTTGACRHNDGEIGCFNASQTCTNMSIVNNLFIGNSTNCGITVTNKGSYTVENNVWYNCPNVAWSFAGSAVTENYNSFLNSGSPGSCQGATPCSDITNTSALDPFASLPTNLNLASDNSEWNNRLSLGAPFDKDMNGESFTTDRGPFQYMASGAVAPVINWATPAAIQYGTELSSSQLNATATSGGTTVDGTFAYSPDMGTMLPAGSQSLSVIFTPSDTADFKPATGSTTVAVNQASQAITFVGLTSPVAYGVNPISLSASGGASNNPIVFTLVSGPGSINGTTLTITAAGTVVVAANQAGNTDYTAAPQKTQSVVVNQASQTITFTAPASPVAYRVSPIGLSATGGASGNPVTFTVVSGPGSIAGNSLTVTGVGTVVIAANQAGGGNFTAATQVTQSITISQASQAISFTPPASPVIYGVSPIALAATGGASGNAVTFSVLSGPGSVSSNSLTITGTGTITVAANQTGNANYAAAAQVTQSIVVNQASQTISFTPPASPVTFGVSPVALIATGGASGNPVTFSVLSGPASISGSTLTITGAGTIAVAANQAGNASYPAAAQVTQSIVVNQKAQAIAFTAPVSPVVVGASPIALMASGGGSGNPVTFSVLSGPGTLNGSTLTVTGAGTVVVAANQSGNTNYLAAAQVTQSITVNLAQQTINFTPPASPVVLGVSPIALVATGGASGNPVTFTVLSGPATVSGSTLTVTAAGTVVVAANQAGNTNFAAASQVTHSITVNQTSAPLVFTLVQKCHPQSHTTNTCTFANNVTPGDLVIGGAVKDDTVASTGVKDGAGNAFTLTPNSPCTGGSVASHAWLFYMLASPGGAKTNTVEFSDTTQENLDDIWVYEFKVTGGTAAFDTDTKGCGASANSTNPVSTLTLAGSNELAYFVSFTAGGKATGVGAPWTLGTLSQLHQVDGYDTSASSAITTAITPANNGWGIVMAMAFKAVPAN